MSFSLRRRTAVPLLFLLAAACARRPARVPLDPSAPKLLVAHAGGALDGATYTNSSAALDGSYARGFRLFEVDLSYTSDNRLVLLHDFEGTLQRLFGLPPGRRPALADLRTSATASGFGFMTDEDLAAWLDAHPDAHVVTDVKERNIEALTSLARRWPKLRPRVVPQVYEFDQLEPARALGYPNVILTLYLCRADDDAVVRFAASHDIFGVTMWQARTRTGRFVERLAAVGVPVFVHTVNDWREGEILFWRGVRGLYTDTLQPPELALHVGKRPAEEMTPRRRRRLALGLSGF